MTIRPATPQDASDIAHVHVATWRATYAGIVPQTYLDALSEADFTAKWAEWLTLPDIVICVAEADQRLIGFASGGPIRKLIAACDAELYAIYILPDRQHQGTGQQLVTHIQTELLKQGRHHVLAWVLRDNPAAAFYQSLGGKLVANDIVEIGGLKLPELAFAWPLSQPDNKSMPEQGSTSNVRVTAQAAKQASHILAPLPLDQRNTALETIAIALEANTARILAANAQDLAAADTLVKTGELSPANHGRLALTAHKLAEMVAQIRAVIALPDPLGRQLDAMELDRGLDLEKITVPLGVLAVIFEARPDAVTQITALALKSGNAVLLKPGREVERTAAALVQIIREALATTAIPPDAVGLILGRDQVAELLHLPQLVDLVIPRGSRALVEHIQANTHIPVLGHADGICHIYVDQHVDQQLALAVIDDAKTDYPAVCNAVETALIHHAVAAEFLPQLASRLRAKDVTLLGDEHTREILGVSQAGNVQDWHTEYGDLTLALRIVDSLDHAIDHIHRYGSAHTESICTTDPSAAARFLNEVDAASVLHNASTRFADGFRFGLGAEVGISTSKIHARGPVGLEGLTTYKYVVRGHGHIVGDYRGPTARPFTHRRQPRAL